MKNFSIILFATVLIWCISPVVAGCGSDGNGKQVKEMIHDQFVELYTFARKGVPESILLKFYVNFINLLKAHVINFAPSTSNFGSHCIEGVNLFFFQGTSASALLNIAIWSILSRTNDVFYLGDIYPSSQLFPLSEDQNEMIEDAWEDAEGELSRSPNDCDTDKVAQLPKTVAFFYDPNGAEVKDDLSDLEDNNISNNRYMDAKEIITMVLGMVLRMEYLEVERDRSLQLLRHCVAYVFNNVRAARYEGISLPILTVHVPFYQGTYKALTADKDTSGVPEISDSVLKTHLMPVINRLSSFDSWGKLTRFDFETLNVLAVPIEDEIFNSTILNDIANAAGITYGGSRQLSTRETGSATEQMTMKSLIRNGAQCNTDLYYFYQLPNTPSTSLECCCANLCLNLGLLATVSVYSSEDCCGYCNEAVCTLDSTNPISDLATVHIEPYGYQEEEAITIMI